jgi:hypothetical protein
MTTADEKKVTNTVDETIGIGIEVRKEEMVGALNLYRVTTRKLVSRAKLWRRKLSGTALN